MSHRYVCLFYHITWSTKKRHPLITKELEPLLYEDLKNLIREQKVSLFALGGTYDHVHILIKANYLLDIANFMRIIKSRSSKLINKVNEIDYFAWQTGYGIFSVSELVVPIIKKYIDNQEVHHKTHEYEKELEMLSNLSSFLKVTRVVNPPEGTSKYLAHTNER